MAGLQCRLAEAERRAEVAERVAREVLTDAEFENRVEESCRGNATTSVPLHAGAASPMERLTQELPVALPPVSEPRQWWEQTHERGESDTRPLLRLEDEEEGEALWAMC
mmetsp:Transcript_24269/g.52569  ORF Transcript_24269/g.52569 Transcript_24269/m.52569 type:complete len:109 (+) Transcript_24269:595-921(+)